MGGSGTGKMTGGESGGTTGAMITAKTGVAIEIAIGIAVEAATIRSMEDFEGAVSRDVLSSKYGNWYENIIIIIMRRILMDCLKPS